MRQKKEKVILTPEQKELLKIKKAVCKRFPDASVRGKLIGEKMHYQIVDASGCGVIDPELMIPPATTVRQAWNNAKYALWFDNMIQKSNAAFNEEKLFKKLAKEYGDND